MHEILWEFEIQMNYPIPARRFDLVFINKIRTCHLEAFVIGADHWIITNKNEKIDKYLDLVRKLKKLWNVNVTVLPIIVDALGVDPKILGKNWGN